MSASRQDQVNDRTFADPGRQSAGASIDGIGVRAIDLRRVDVAVDLGPCLRPVTVEIVVVGPEDQELGSTLLIENRERALDRILHLRQDAAQGLHTLHVGLFEDGELVAHGSRSFSFDVVRER